MDMERSISPRPHGAALYSPLTVIESTNLCNIGEIAPTPPDEDLLVLEVTTTWANVGKVTVAMLNAVTEVDAVKGPTI